METELYKLHTDNRKTITVLLICLSPRNIMTISFSFRPCVVYKNPLTHNLIQVMTGISLDANEVLVVYRQDDESKKVDRYLQHGPTLFIPDANEWYLYRAT